MSSFRRDNRKWCKYVCLTANQLGLYTKPNPNPDPATKQSAVVTIQQNVIKCPICPEKFIRDNDSINQSIKYYFIVRPKVDQRAGQLCLPHIGITKTEENGTKT